MATEELKQEAKELGIKFNPQIGDEKLQEKIDAHYESQETSGVEIQEAVIAKEAAEETVVTKPAVSGKKTMGQIAREIYDKARETSVVIITDNDQRVNNQTTTCKANWSNEYYDLGSRIFPLNMAIEVPNGFIQVLREVQIPHHIKNNQTGLFETRMRNRYSVSNEDGLKKD